MRAGNFVAALLTSGLGLFMVKEAGKMNIGFTGELHAGIFPRLMGIGFLLLGLCNCFRNAGLLQAPKEKYHGLQVNTGREQPQLAVPFLYIYLFYPSWNLR